MRDATILLLGVVTTEHVRFCDHLPRFVSLSGVRYFIPNYGITIIFWNIPLYLQRRCNRPRHDHMKEDEIYAD